MRIERIRRHAGKPWVYAELREDDGSLAISATLDHIVERLKSESFRLILEGRAQDEMPYCIHCRCQQDSK